jgi:CheY-like chemotaxis protein
MTPGGKALLGKRVLVVEDEPIVAMMLEDMLAALGAELAGSAASVEQALTLVERGALDAAVLDMNLNGERSHAVADALRRRAVPFVFATGYGSGVEEETAEPLLQKPYRQDQLAALLGRAIAAAGAR